MFWNTYYEGTHLAPRQYGSLPSLRSNVKHLTAIEEFPHLYGKKNDRLETLHPDTKYYRRKLEIRAYAPSDLRKPLVAKIIFFVLIELFLKTQSITPLVFFQFNNDEFS